MSSVVYELLAAVKTRLQTVTGAPTPVIRTKPVVLKGDTFPLWIVCFMEPERKGQQQFGGVIHWLYPVFVGIVTVSTHDFTVSTTTYDTREAVRDKLFQPTLTGIPSAPDGAQSHDMTLDPGVPIDFQGQPAANFEVSSFLATYQIAERRDA